TPGMASARYQIGVWFRSAGNGADSPESARALAFTIQAPPPATLTDLSADKATPQPVGTTITFTASVTGGTAPYQYKWWLFDGSGIGRAQCRGRGAGYA